MMGDDKKRDDEPTLKVTDRRRVDETGELREEKTPAAEEGTGVGERTSAEQDAAAQAGEARRAAGFPQKVDFPTFVYSMFTQGLIAMGAMANPETGERMDNVELAKNTIDILEMIEEKTVGNLSEAEDKMLRSLLYELRMRFVQHMRGRGVH